MADLHIHSKFSDGKLSIPEIVDLYGSQNFGAIAITDHLCEEKTLIGKVTRYLGCSLTRESLPNYFELLQTEKERAWKKYRMLLIPGLELTKNTISNHRSAHIVALGIEDFIGADADVVSLAREIRKKGGLSIAAHPVSTRQVERQTYYLWNRKDELEDELDAWEVASGPVFFDEVASTRLRKIANSDLHHPKQMQSWKTKFFCERNQEAIFESIRKQKISFEFFSFAWNKALSAA